MVEFFCIFTFSFVSYAHLDGHENHEDVMLRNKRSSNEAEIDDVISNTDMTTVSTAGTTVVRPSRTHKISELSTDIELEGAITATDMTFASEKSRDVIRRPFSLKFVSFPLN